METIEQFLRQFPPIVMQALPIWIGGGWAMIPLAVTGLIMYSLGLSALFQLLAQGARLAPEKAWRAWQKNPAGKTVNPFRRIIADAMQCATLHEMEMFFQLLDSEGIRPFAHRLQVMKVCVTTAPLIGLLGTVTGMLTTFGGLAKGGSSDQTMGFISKGISEALITTETGLIIALTGMFILFFLMRQQQGRQEGAWAGLEA
jgi:biopolymer transport protein ExbB